MNIQKCYYFITLSHTIKTPIFSWFKRITRGVGFGCFILLAGCMRPINNNNLPFKYLSTGRYQVIAKQIDKQGASVFRQSQSIRIVLPGKQLFIPGTTHINPSAKNMLNLVAELVQHAPQAKIQILGYTDNVLFFRQRQAISQQMANTVAAHLWHRGASREKMRIKGMGDRYPISGARTAAGNVSNQRVEVLIN